MDLSTMFSADRVDDMHARLLMMAEDLGVPFYPQQHAPSTKKALAVSELARREGVLDGWREAAMTAHWEHGRDLEDEAVLRELATQAGLDPDQALAFLDSDEVPGLLREQRLEAQRWGATGIPTWFVLPDGWTPADGVPETGPRPVKVVGCQPLELVVRAAELAGATPRR
jgi:predicted DsbA family dithiol-disulfide isomerase